MGGTTGKGKLEKPVFEGVGNLSYSCIPPHSFYNSFSFVFGIAKGKESIPAFIPNLFKKHVDNQMIIAIIPDLEH
ncbi:hypothetical protein [Prevotella jejuni]|uniref:hypothetical protein n=1 Tax=Prevotella jejuni TaxID=1177574 RepID=UPI003211A8C2